ncbi:bleomycin hydrolase [Glugoides intestinalis]
MELLDFAKLRKRFELKQTNAQVNVFLFSKEGENIKIHSKTASNEAKDFVKSMNPQGSTGEVFTKEKSIFICIGKTGNDATVSQRTNVCKAMKALYTTLKRFNEHEILFEDSEFTEDAIFALILASYSYDFLKKSKEDVQFFLNAPKYEKVIEIAHAQNVARFFGDTPANLMTPTLFVEYAKKFFENENFINSDELLFEVYSKDFMEKNDMNLILSVNQGSVEEPKLLRIKYNPNKGDKNENVDISLVGKGVCFDTGGISIKPAANMHKMKHDMMGAATLMCTLMLAVKFKVNKSITLVLPLVENMPSGSATKPGDVFRSMNGLTVEVDNTDAEGRLILADALTYAQKENPEYLFDAATLTGAMVVALGSVYAGYFTSDDQLSKLIFESGVETNDHLWRMPLSPFYREALKSYVADMKNIGSVGGGSCIAAEFLKEFVDTKKCKWAHFDIAGTMTDSYLSDVYGADATGRPIRAFIRLIEKLSLKE